MSTTHVQSLPNVRGRMSYTEFGEGKRRREHLENGTDRIAAQMGDAASREDFIVYCEGQKHRHPNAVNEGYEVRISWATDELDPSRQDDIQRGMEYAYTLCHELAPDSMCWVTMHVDGEGGCVHAHATIANHDARSGQVINKEGTSLYAPRVQAVNDRLSRENGFQVLGADKEMSTWAQRRDTFAYDSFDRRLGDKVAYARDALDHPCPNLLAGAWVFAKAGRDAKDPVSRMMADMTAMMLRMLLQQAMEEQRRREREAAERRLYESRKNMWDAEKRLKSAEKALAHEDEREEQAKLVRLQEREDKAARRAGGRVKYGTDADKQYE